MAWVLLHMPPLTRQGENNFPLYRKRYKLFKSCICGVKFNKHTHTHIYMDDKIGQNEETDKGIKC